MVEKQINYDKIKVGTIVEVTTLGNKRFTGYVVEENMNQEHPESSVFICRILDGNVLATTFESLNIKSSSARAVPLAGCKYVNVLAEPEISHPKFGIKIDEDVSYNKDNCTCYQTKIPHLSRYITLCVRESENGKSYGWSEGTNKQQNLQESYIVSYTGKAREESLKVLEEDFKK